MRNDWYSPIIQEIGHFGAIVRLACKQGDVRVLITFVFGQVADDGLYPIKAVIRLVFSIIEFNLHQTTFGFGLFLENAHAFTGTGLLCHIHFLRFRRKLLICSLKESIVKIDHIRKRAVIGVQILEGEIVLHILLILHKSRLAFILGQSVNLGQIDDLLHLATAETINGLLAITHHHAHLSGSQTIVNQRQKVLPLQNRGILKLVYKHMAEMLANALIHKGNRKITHHGIEQFVELRNVNHFFLIGQLLKLNPNLRTKGIKIKQVALRPVKQELT